MNAGRTVFSQLMALLPLQAFRKCVQRYRGDCYIKNFSCRDQFLVMAFAQLTFWESLRDIQSCLRAVPSKRYHPGHRQSGVSEYANRCQRKPRLADLCRLRSRSDRQSPQTLSSGRVRPRVGTDRLCLRTRRPSICVWPCSLGPSFVGTRAFARVGVFAILFSRSLFVAIFFVSSQDIPSQCLSMNFHRYFFTLNP